MADEIRVLLIYEILGRPPEHIKKALETFVEDFNDKKGIKLESSTFHEPKLIEKKEPNEGAPENTKELFTNFAEVELLVDNLNILFSIVLNTLPANVEILEPSSLRLNNFDLSGVLSELTIKLHKYDEVTKIVTIERNNLLNKLKETEEKLNPPGPQLNITTGIKPEEDKPRDTEGSEPLAEKPKKKKKD